MKAIVSEDGRAVPSERPAPDVRAGFLRVAVRACALNRADLGMAAGRLHGATGGAGAILGLEFAGTVTDVGQGVVGWAPGDRVMASGPASFAEVVLVDAGRALRLPDSLSFEEGACLPVALQTMHDAMVTHGGLGRGQTVLVQGASSGVGLMALQIARHLGAGLVVGSSTTPARRARLAGFGAHLAVDSQDPAWLDSLLAATSGRGVDLVVDQLSGPGFNRNLQATAIGGCIVNVGRLAGRTGEIDFDLHALRRIRHVGVTFRTRTADEVREVTRRMHAELGAAVASRTLNLPIDRRFALADASQALEHMRSNAHFGKIVLVVD